MCLFYFWIQYPGLFSSWVSEWCLPLQGSVEPLASHKRLCRLHPGWKCSLTFLQKVSLQSSRTGAWHNGSGCLRFFDNISQMSRGKRRHHKMRPFWKEHRQSLESWRRTYTMRGASENHSAWQLPASFVDPFLRHPWAFWALTISPISHHLNNVPKRISILHFNKQSIANEWIVAEVHLIRKNSNLWYLIM